MPVSDQGPEQDIGELARVAGLEAVTGQLTGMIAVLRAEQARRAGTAISRPTWKNLVFAGGPGTGKSRAAGAIASIYYEQGVLPLDRVLEVAAADLAGATGRETGILMDQAARRADGGVLMITTAHAWAGLPDRGQQMLRCLYAALTESRDLMHGDLAIILAGQTGPLRDLLAASPPLAARFPAVVDFPGYTPAQLAAIFAALAGEAGLALTPAAATKAARVLAQADAGHGSGNARLAVGLLARATASQARRVTSASQSQNPAALSTIDATDIPRHMDRHRSPADDERPGQYL